MGKKLFWGICPRCEQKLVILCPETSHLLHLFLTFLTLGAWGVVWIICCFRSVYACRCCACDSRAVRVGRMPLASSGCLAKPWLDDRFHFQKKRKNFNAMLIENGLVFYAATRSKPLRKAHP